MSVGSTELITGVGSTEPELVRCGSAGSGSRERE
jgi:hypothetical protein